MVVTVYTTAWKFPFLILIFYADESKLEWVTLFFWVLLEGGFFKNKHQLTAISSTSHLAVTAYVIVAS